ncbi:hypothetical protein [Leisingera aquaemixtae]|nr:hypothetical protein [Leisingera aquaemixtae]
MSDETVLQSWQKLHDCILAALIAQGSDRHVKDFESWYAQEAKTAPAPAILHVSVGLDGLKVGYQGADDVVDRLMRATKNINCDD